METLNKQYNITARKSDFIYIGFLLFLFLVLTEFFFRQTVRFADAYNSDTYVYAQGSDSLSNIRLIVIIFNALRSINGQTYEIAIFMALVVIATILACYKLISLLLERSGVNLERWKQQGLSLIGFFCGPIWLPLLYEHFYMRTWPRYAWHSPTQELMTLFAVLTIIMLIKVYDGYMEEVKPGQWAGLTVLAFCSAWSKPNFIFALIPVILVLMVKGLFTNNGYSFGRRLVRVIILGSTMIPAGIYTIIQSRVEASDHGGNVAFRPGYFLMQSENPVLMILLSLAFALVVYAFNLKSFKTCDHQIIGGLFLAAVAESVLLVESGAMINHGNLNWGRDCGTFILFLGAIGLAVKNYNDKSFLADRPGLRRGYFIVLLILIAAHVLSELVYLQLVIRGHLYRM